MEPPVHAPRLGFGLVGRTAERAVELAALGPELERLGYDELWVNDGRDRSALDTLAVLSHGTTAIDLCVGVTPLDERPPAWIAERVATLGLPHRAPGAGGRLGRQCLAASWCATAWPSCAGWCRTARVAVSALGPRMCRLAGEVADVVLLNWTFPDRVAWARERIARGAALGERPPPRVAGYVRIAVGPDAEERLATEAARYARRPRSYAVLFSEQGAGAARLARGGGGSPRAGACPAGALPGQPRLLRRPRAAAGGRPGRLARGGARGYPAAMTYSIVARDPQTGRFGVAVQSHYLGVGPVVPWLEAGVGAIATQASVNVSFGPIGLELLRAGRSAEETVAALLASDPQAQVRQLGVVDAAGRAAAHTGTQTIPAAGHLVGGRLHGAGQPARRQHLLAGHGQRLLRRPGRRCAVRGAAAACAGSGRGAGR